MNLSDRLNEAQQHVADARRQRLGHPKGFEPGVKYEAGLPSEVTVSLTAVPKDEVEWRKEIHRVTELEVPDHRRVELSQVRYWGPKDDPYIYCRFLIVDRGAESGLEVDAVSLLTDLRKGSRLSTPQGAKALVAGDSAFVLSWNDLQVGKLEGGGTPALVERWDNCIKSAISRIKELTRLKRGISHLVIIGGGDVIENCAMFTNHAFAVDADRRTQIRTAVTLILDGIDRLAPLFEKVTVLVVGGNHGENRVDYKRTTPADNDDCAVFEHAALAASRDDRLKHVNFVIAQGEQSKTLEISGWVLGTTHGHVFGKGSGGSIEQKSLKWFQGQAAGRQPIGDADVFVTHHFHHFAARAWGSTLWVQTPAMDGGSMWLTDMSGMSDAPGMLSFVMSPECKFKDMQIL